MSHLSEEARKQLAIDINRLIAIEAGHPLATNDEICATLPDFSKELSRTLVLIYRDWQAAIGDLVLKRNEKESRKFEVVGYKEFEQLYLSESSEHKKWLERASRLFKNLDVTVEERFDGRTRQLKDLYKTVYEILLALSKISTSNVDLAKISIKRLPKLMG